MKRSLFQISFALFALATLWTPLQAADKAAQIKEAQEMYFAYLVKMDAPQQLKWLKKLVKLGDANSQEKLGEDYEKGEGGVAQDPKEAKKLYQKSAAQGNQDAKNALDRLNGKTPSKPVTQESQAEKYQNLGLACILKGDKDGEFKWAQKGADIGDPGCEDMLASCYETGDGTPIDLKEARKWYEKAQAQGLDETAALKRINP